MASHKQHQNYGQQYNWPYTKNNQHQNYGLTQRTTNTRTMSLPKEQPTSELLLYTKINQYYDCGLTQRITNTRVMTLHKEQQTPELWP